MGTLTQSKPRRPHNSATHRIGSAAALECLARRAGAQECGAEGVDEGVVQDRDDCQRRTEFVLPRFDERQGGDDRDEEFLKQPQWLSETSGLMKVDGSPEAEPERRDAETQGQLRRRRVAGVEPPVGETADDADLGKDSQNEQNGLPAGHELW